MMSDTSVSRQDLLDAAIEALTADAAAQGYVVTDAVLVVGMERLDENGRRAGGVGIYTRKSGTPEHIAKGLLVSALDRVRTCE